MTAGFSATNPLALLLRMADAAPAEGESRLIELAQRGDLAAFEELLVANQSRLLRVARGLLRRPDDAPDALQEIFLRLHRNLNRFDRGRDWRAWSYRVALNVCRDFNRRRRWRDWLPLPEKFDPPGLAADPQRQAAAAEEWRRARAALARLPEQERVAIVLRELEGLTAGEAARLMGCSEGTVRSHSSRARAKLARWLGRPGGRR